MHEYSILNGITKVPFRKEYHSHERPKEKHNIETNNIMEIKVLFYCVKFNCSTAYYSNCAVAVEL